MTRIQLLIVACALACGIGMVPALAIGATESAPPAGIDPASLQLLASQLPAGSTLAHSAISDNDDASGGKSSDGDVSVFGLGHQGSASYSAEGRTGGYRMDIRYNVQGTPVATAYLASIYPDQAHAQKAYADATGANSLTGLIGGKPLSPACTAGTRCDAETFVIPLHASYQAITAVFVRGPFLIETASEIDVKAFPSLEPEFRTDIYNMLNAADGLVQDLLSGSANLTPTVTLGESTPVNTATSTPVPTAAPVPARPLFVTVRLSHKTIRPGKRQTVSVTTALAAQVRIVVHFPGRGNRRHNASAGTSGRVKWSFRQPKIKAAKGKRMAVVVVRVRTPSGGTKRARRTYTIR